MPDKTLVYSKQSGELPVPVTVQIEWLPCGTIKPIMYWTPDDSCYMVKHIAESVHLAHLKDKDVGIRFKVRAEIIETLDTHSNHRNFQQETYLYFADNWFSGRNIIDSRYGHAGKEYISVALDVFPNADYELVYFIVKDERYMVEKTVCIEPRGSFNAGGIGVRHEVNAILINPCNDEDPEPHKSIRRKAAIYFEINKWFTSVKSTAL